MTGTMYDYVEGIKRAYSTAKSDGVQLQTATWAPGDQPIKLNFGGVTYDSVWRADPAPDEGVPAGMTLHRGDEVDYTYERTPRHGVVTELYVEEGRLLCLVQQPGAISHVVALADIYRPDDDN